MPASTTMTSVPSSPSSLSVASTSTAVSATATPKTKDYESAFGALQTQYGFAASAPAPERGSPKSQPQPQPAQSQRHKSNSASWLKRALSSSRSRSPKPQSQSRPTSEEERAKEAERARQYYYYEDQFAQLTAKYGSITSHTCPTPFDITRLQVKTPTQVSAMALFMDLNDDILLIILSYLQKRDILWTVISLKRHLPFSWLHENIGTNARYVREMAIYLIGKAPRLPDVLFATKNIRHLVISSLLHHFDDPRFSVALSELFELRKLSCNWAHNKMLPTIQSIPSPNLTSLCLRYEGGRDLFDHLPSLISAIASFPRLYALILNYFRPTAAVDIASYPPFPSIHQLTLHGVTEPATDLVYLCPNVTSLKLGLERPYVRESIISLLERHDVHATHVRLSMLWGVKDDGISFAITELASELTRVLAALKPHSLCLEITVTWDTRLFYRTGTLWQMVATAAPHLRALVLDVESFDNDTEDGEPQIWTPPDALVAELARLPLVAFHLKADPAQLFERNPEADTGDRLRLRALAAFPGRLAAVISTLRVVGVSDGWRQGEGVRSTRWWRVERGERNGASRWLVELWREDGERALRLVQNEAFCASDLDDIYSEKCRYVRW
ncbi:uncharacterized protein BXZ73DRAFT_104534 [Epithele typhae]|uniref:uncharacterized protein n=1 Tax=Epithele typhae TaxID=378194 RepID=UPI00200801B0|nr:uncharacterized protein BXZ73DRAFT_104534 [Epithele typhae]KAH9921244.1 hypothetical protein BXZ73DRAFT_104534 [Epithele typhae]